MPENWRTSPDTFDFALGAGEELQQTFEVMFPFNASSGEQPVQIDFEVSADQPYRFSANRTLEIGLGDVIIDLAGRLNEDGELELEQRLTNRSDREVSFRCQLLAPNRRRVRSQVMRLLAPGEDVQTYRLHVTERNSSDRLSGCEPKKLAAQERSNYKYVVEPDLSVEKKDEEKTEEKVTASPMATTNASVAISE